MVWVLVSAFLWGSVSGITEYSKIRDRALYKENNPEYLVYSQRWHQLQFLDKGLGLTAGIAISFDAINAKDKNILTGVSDVVLVSAIRWIVFDGAYNLSNNNAVFHRSNSTTSNLEELGTPLLKLGFLAVAIILRLIIN